MKNLMILVFILASFHLLAGPHEHKASVVLRTENNKAITQEVNLPHLISSDSFDGKYFKIVKGKSEVALTFNEASDVLLRAATVYFHLNKARDYFVERLGSSYVKDLPKIVIRIDHKNQFSELGHFAHDNFSPQFNNALTIPAGKGLPSRGIKPWEMEIWFRPMKKVHLRDLKVNNLGNRELQGLLKQFRNQIHMQSLQRFMSQVVVATTSEAVGVNPLGLDSLVRTVGSSVMMEAGYQFIDPITNLVSRKWYWLDTALVPEIIYHEYAHVALSDHLELSHSTPVIEGMADFFAGQIAQSPKLAKHIKKYNTYNGKDASKKKDYMIQFESNEYANTDFVFGMLWELKSILNENKGEAFMYELRTKVKTNSSIRNQLIEGILENCDNMCETPFIDKLKILKAFSSRGL